MLKHLYYEHLCYRCLVKLFNQTGSYVVSCLACFISIFLLQGYGGGDEVNMLQRHLLGTSTKFGVGAKRAVVASHLIQKYGYIDIRKSSLYEKQNLNWKAHNSLDSEKIGILVLDDAMQVKSNTSLSHTTLVCFPLY